MQLLSILALSALARGALASNLCKVNQRYCGSAFEQFDNADDFQADDNTLYVCEDFDGTPPGTFGESKKYTHQPAVVQKCPKTCHIAGGGENDYCTGEKLFDNNEKYENLARCAEHQYKETAKWAIKTTTKLELLRLEKNHYDRLIGCVYSTTKIQSVDSSDKYYSKQVDELLDSLLEGQKKAKEAFEAEEEMEAKAGNAN